jgi:hypothetical protein
METLEAVAMIEHLKQGLGKQGQVSLLFSHSPVIDLCNWYKQINIFSHPPLFFLGCTYRADRSKGRSLHGNPREYFKGSERSP